MQFTSVRLSTHDLGMTREELALATLLSLSLSLSTKKEKEEKTKLTNGWRVAPRGVSLPPAAVCWGVAGAYDDEEAAARAYDLAALKYWGLDTILNFPVPYRQNSLVAGAIARIAHLVPSPHSSRDTPAGVRVRRGAQGNGGAVQGGVHWIPEEVLVLLD